MKIVKPSVEFLWMTINALQEIERAGRTCYKSEEKITKDSAIKFVHSILNNGHESVIEHASMSYRIICDRWISHELVRHRLFSYSQESTRYCNYGNKDIEFIQPPGLSETAKGVWINACNEGEMDYNNLLAEGCKPEIARSVLPGCIKTEIVTTGNFREWRHFFSLRTSPKAHPQMREIADMILVDAAQRVSIVFDEYGRS